MELLMEYLNLVLDVLSVVGGSAVVAASPVAKYLRFYLPAAKRLVDVLAMNVHEAKNKKH